MATLWKYPCATVSEDRAVLYTKMVQREAACRGFHRMGGEEPQVVVNLPVMEGARGSMAADYDALDWLDQLHLIRCKSKGVMEQVDDDYVLLGRWRGDERGDDDND